jgi:diguanylate cyclase (GGDEF)-like protein
MYINYDIQTILGIFVVDGFLPFTNQTFSKESILFYEGFIHLAVTILFFVLTVIFSKKKNVLGLWTCCHLLIVYFVINSLMNMYFCNNAAEVLGYFTITLVVGLFIPDFKRRFWPSLIFYFATVYIASQLSIAFMIEFQTMLFMIALAISVIKMSHYNSKAKVFVETLKLRELNEKLEALSTIDELTKLDNRRSFHNYFEMIWKQSSRLETPVNAIMIDIDYFKKYNDSLGHLEGDKVLFAVAQCLKNQIKRETDFVARFGGEEFVCLLPYIKKNDAEDFAKKLVQSIEDLKIPHPKSEHSQYVTISAGMSSIIPKEKNTTQELLDKADKALYEAKQSGRNKVIVNR